MTEFDKGVVNAPAESQAVARESPSPDQLTQSLFSVPVFLGKCREMTRWNEELANLILELEKTHAGPKQSNYGGWQSEKLLHKHEHPGIKTLLSTIRSASDLFTRSLVGQTYSQSSKIIAWANVNRANNFNTLHHHVGGFWSGVYYVQTGMAAAREGSIVFRNPAPSGIISALVSAPTPLAQLFKEDLYVNPSAGMMLLFPSWLEHFVYPHYNVEPRISIAFDIAYPEGSQLLYAQDAKPLVSPDSQGA